MHIIDQGCTLVHSAKVFVKLSNLSDAPVLSLQGYMHGVRTCMTANEGQMAVQDGAVWNCVQSVRELDRKLLLGEHWEEHKVAS